MRPGLFARLRARLQRRDVDRELDDELRFHVEMEAEAYRSRGLSPADARRAALRDLGGAVQTTESVRDVRSLGVEPWVRDLWLGLRRLRREPGFAAAAILTLTLGIGANTAGLSIAHGLYWRSIPGVAEPDRVIRLQLHDPQRNWWGSFDAARIRDLEALDRLFVSVAGDYELDVDLSIGGQPERATAVFATPAYFRTLGVGIAVGRAFSDSDQPPEAVISDAVWRDRFGRRDDAIGATISVNGHAFTVVGITPRGFVCASAWDDGPRPPHVWLPPASARTVTGSRREPTFDPIARLQPHVSTADLPRQLSPTAERWRADTGGGHEFRIRPLRHPLPANLLTLLAIPLVVLLVACANLAALLLARGVARAHEVATRRALGASTWDIVRQRVIEAMVLACAGSVIGLVGAYWTARWFVAALRLPDIELVPDAVILAGTAVTFLIAVALFGALPALAAARVRWLLSARSAGGSGAGPNRSRMQRALVVAQIALSLMLLASGAAVLRTLDRINRSMAPGFDVSPAIVTASVNLDPHPYTADERRVLLQHILARISALPDVERAAFAEAPPFARRLFYGGTMDAGRPRASGVRVSSGYFGTMGIPLVRGRGFTDDDRASAQRVAIVTSRMAQAWWPNRNPIGQHFILNTSGAGGPRDAGVTVVGVAADIDVSVRRPDFYLPFEQHMGRGGSGWEELTLMVRGRGDRPPSLAPIRETVRQINPHVSLFDVASVRALADRLTERERGISAAIAALGGAALLLAVIGTFGVMAFTAAQHRRETGIRIALGARPSDITRLTLRGGLWIAAGGISLGTALGVAATRLIATQMLPGTPVAAGSAAGVLVLVTFAVLIACYLPARGAARVDPVEVLRVE
jgi:predicted permease